MGAAALRFAPDPELQRLIDPRPAPGGLAWLGADVASSAEVGDGRWVWIFGDTLLGSVRDVCPAGETYCDRDIDDRPAAAMIANSVGVITRAADGSLSPISKHWRTADGVPAPIFTAEDPAELLWPLALAPVGDVLLIAASRHTRAEGLRSLGSVLLRVANPEAPPEAWVYTRHAVPNVVTEAEDDAVLTWSTALVPDGGFVYLFGRRGAGREARTVLARLRASDVAEPDWRPRPEYLLCAARTEVLAGDRVFPGSRGASRGRRLHARKCGGGIAAALARAGFGTETGVGHRGPAVWTAELEGARLCEVTGLPGTSEAAIAFDDALGWYTFQIPWLTLDVRLYTAPCLTGPWRDEGVVYEIPAPRARTHLRWDVAGAGERVASEAYVAYAAKPHVELATQGTFAFSYNVNAMAATLRDSLRALEQVPGIYVPQLVSSRSYPGGGWRIDATAGCRHGSRRPDRASLAHRW